MKQHFPLIIDDEIIGFCCTVGSGWLELQTADISLRVELSGFISEMSHDEQYWSHQKDKQSNSGSQSTSIGNTRVCVSVP